jgi:hypothetical protein
MGAERKEGDVAPDQFIENHFCKWMKLCDDNRIQWDEALDFFRYMYVCMYVCRAAP